MSSDFYTNQVILAGKITEQPKNTTTTNGHSLWSSELKIILGKGKETFIKLIQFQNEYSDKFVNLCVGDHVYITGSIQSHKSISKETKNSFYNASIVVGKVVIITHANEDKISSNQYKKLLEEDLPF